jgi:hypothetical protein
MICLPSIRPGLLRHRLDNQLLAYDPHEDRVHLLDPTTGCVLELLEEGGWTPETLLAELSARTGVSADADLLALSLEELRKADLLNETPAIPAPMTEVSRRQALRRVGAAGIAALLIPAIVTLTPTPAYAVTACSMTQGRPGGCSCNAGIQCASLVCLLGHCAL